MKKNVKIGKETFILREMSIDDMDYCGDVVSQKLDDNSVVFYGLNKARTAWLRKGVEGMTDKVLKSLTDEEKSDLLLKVKEFQELGE